MLYSVHEPPQERKLEALESFLKAEGMRKNWKETPEPSQFSALQQRVKGTASDHLLNAVLLRSLSLAVYSPDNKGHFGLALTEYAHFTSPIRRYPDLLLHRAIKHAVRKHQPEQFSVTDAEMEQLGRRCSFTERRAEEASRDVDERLKCQFMMRHLGDTFEGVITGVVGFGLFVELLDLGVSGLVHITALPEDYYDFDATSHRLIGKKKRRVFRLAERVRVKVLGVNLEERKIDFEWAGDET
jgi:ribonuclease R